MPFLQEGQQRLALVAAQIRFAGRVGGAHQSTHDHHRRRGVHAAEHPAETRKLARRSRADGIVITAAPMATIISIATIIRRNTVT
jgi:hypothetical protein